jgi:hypothetical protein
VNNANATPTGRRLQTNGTSEIDMTILEDRTTDDYPEPTLIADRLNSQMTTLKRLLPTIDTSQSIAPSVISIEQCEFT